MKAKSKQKISTIQRKLWKECRRVADILYKPQNGSYRCFTCNKVVMGKNKHLGHVPYPKSVLGAYLKYDMRCLRWQCYFCNIHAGGMGAEAYKKMLRQEGKAYMDKLYKDKEKIVKTYEFYEKLLEKYKKL